MAGHSKFKNIMFRKGAQDKKRAKLFSKLAKEITVAAKLGMPDPAGPDVTFDEKIRLRRAAANEWLQSFPDRDAMIAAMARLNLAWGDAREATDVRTQPTVAYRNSVVDIDDRAGGTRPIVQSPYRFSDAESGVRGPAPHRGEHNVTVLSDWCGIGEDRVQALLAEGVLLRDENMPV